MNQIIFESHPRDFILDFLDFLEVDLGKLGLLSACYEVGEQFTFSIIGPTPKNFDFLIIEKWEKIGVEGWSRIMEDDLKFEWDATEYGGKIHILPGISAVLDLVIDYKIPAKTIEPRHGESGLGDALEVDPKAPYVTAHQLLSKDWSWQDPEAKTRCQTLHRVGGEYFYWDGARYKSMTNDAIRRYLYDRLSNAVSITDGTSFNPDQSKLNKIEDALRSAAFQEGDSGSDFWFDDDGNCNLISTETGLLDPLSRDLQPHSPRFFTRSSVPVAYGQQSLEAPVELLHFLDSVFPNDLDSVRLLRQWFGYMLTNRTDLQKILLLVGPPRSGKGTICAVLSSLLGAGNVAGPTLFDFTSQFGLAQLIGKKAAIVGDARFAGRHDQMAQVASRLLAISGGDILTVDRKHIDPWIGRIGARLVICSNELPRLTDNSGALANRFSILQMRRSFLGSEDRRLAERLQAELSSILNWSLDGLDDLNTMGNFLQPESSQEAKKDLDAITSPIADFVDDVCEFCEGASIPCQVLFDKWREYCVSQGREHPGTLQLFGRDLKAAFPSVKTEQMRSGNMRGKRAFIGVRLREPTF
ncbi:phage/plasmid primase, P4 family [Acidovorax sp. KKS102]|uniref:DNA primase family protein n=1 Tax=Acidovorax sp. KKS102 TaxID=358220 RepID=UPI0002F015D7|nr:phage/plasmid primase, P4 family [Acidovorax sp. KKS102]